MAKQVGLIKISGSIDGLIFSNTKNGYEVRRKGELSKERIATDPAFQRSRENSSEFGRAAMAGKLFRNAFSNMRKHSSDYQLTARVAKLMSQLKDLDQINLRGQRSPAQGIQTPGGKALLKGFNFNQDARLNSVLSKRYEFDANLGHVEMVGLDPYKDLLIAKGATHVCFRSAWAGIDFEQGRSETCYGEPSFLLIKDEVKDVQLRFEKTPSPASGVQVIVLQVLFYQEVNGTLYFLKNTNHNGMEVVAVF